jgi:hypothetical protein
MKKPVLYLLLFAYSTILLRPAMPYIADGMAHLLWYHEHIATVHIENGKQHVHIEVEKENKKNSAENNAEENKKASSISEHSSSSIAYSFCPMIIQQNHFPNKFIFYSGTKPQRNYPPPRC